MDWQTAFKRLGEIEAHIRTGEMLISRARKKLKLAMLNGLDPGKGKRALYLLKAAQALYLEERARLKELLKRLAN
jgi:hypothetical protein